MKIKDLLVESMDLMPVVLKDNRTSWVFPETWIDDRMWPHNDNANLGSKYSDDDGPPPKNPNFKSWTAFNLSNDNAHRFMEALGYQADNHYLIPINEFIARITQWLKKNVGKPSGAVEPVETTFQGGAKIIDGGLPEGYLNKRMLQAAKIAREGKNLGATHISVA